MRVPGSCNLLHRSVFCFLHDVTPVVRWLTSTIILQVSSLRRQPMVYMINVFLNAQKTSVSTSIDVLHEVSDSEEPHPDVATVCLGGVRTYCHLCIRFWGHVEMLEQLLFRLAHCQWGQTRRHLRWNTFGPRNSRHTKKKEAAVCSSLRARFPGERHHKRAPHMKSWDRWWLFTYNFEHLFEEPC